MMVFCWYKLFINERNFINCIYKLSIFSSNWNYLSVYSSYLLVPLCGVRKYTTTLRTGLKLNTFSLDNSTSHLVYVKSTNFGFAHCRFSSRRARFFPFLSTLVRNNPWHSYSSRSLASDLIQQTNWTRTSNWILYKTCPRNKNLHKKLSIGQLFSQKRKRQKNTGDYWFPGVPNVADMLAIFFFKCWISNLYK